MNNYTNLNQISPDNLKQHISQYEIDILYDPKLTANMIAEKPQQFKELILRILGRERAIEYFQALSDAIINYTDD